MVCVGSPAPEFTLPDQHGRAVTLSSLRGQWVVLWWYPKAQTPGCTAQGQSFRDLSAAFGAQHAVIVGASFDTPADNLAFAQAQNFPYTLLSDTATSVGEAYGVKKAPDEQWAAFPRRMTFLIDPSGVVRKIYTVEDPGRNAQDVLDDIEALTA
jgi:peroxiredoxin Q/BCP